MTAASTMVACVSCHGPVGPIDHFCEACGSEQPPPTASTSAPPPTRDACASCGAPAADIDAEGYCGQCGMRRPPRDHVELVRHGIAGVTDRGRTHQQNEDAMALGRASSGDGGWIAVVADGVSSSQHPELASQAAVDATLGVLAPALDDGQASLADACAAAVTAASDAVRAIAWDPDRRDVGAPACTLAVAAWRPGRPLVVLSIGDARCYWLGADGDCRCLTDDDSWAAEQLAAGASPDDVANDHRAHAITSWLGADAPPVTARVKTVQVPDRGGRVIVCSDGLWNYTDDVHELRDRTDGARAEGPPPEQPEQPDWSDEELLSTALRAVTFANDAGGHDNITVVVARVAPLETATSPGPSLSQDGEG